MRKAVSTIANGAIDFSSVSGQFNVPPIDRVTKIVTSIGAKQALLLKWEAQLKRMAGSRGESLMAQAIADIKREIAALEQELASIGGAA